MSENKMRAIFRVRYPRLKLFLLRFRGSAKSNSNVSSKNVPADVITVGEVLGFLQSNDAVTLTNKGREMLLAYGSDQEGNERRILRTAFEKNGQLRLHWAMICDKRELFTMKDLIEVFRDLGYSDLAETSLIQYIRAFVDWSEAAGLCAKDSIKGHTYKILYPMNIGALSSIETLHEDEVVAAEETNPEKEEHVGLFKLNSYICDFLVEPTHEADLDAIKSEIERLRGNGVIDDLILVMLEREINMAMETRSATGFAAVAQTLRDLRNRFVREGQLS